MFVFFFLSKNRSKLIRSATAGGILKVDRDLLSTSHEWHKKMGTLTCELNWVLHWYVNSEDTRNNEMCRNRHSSYPCCQREQDTHTLFSQNILIVPTEFSSSSDHHREFITFMNILWFSSVAWQMVSSDSDRGRGIVEGTISGVTTRELRISYMLQLSYEFLLFLVTSMRTDVDTSESSHNHNAVASSSRSTPNTDLSW